MLLSENLPSGLLGWIASTVKGEITKITRHTARREAWIVETASRAGASQRHFLRLDRALATGKVSMRNLRRETKLLEFLSKTDVPAQKVIGWSDDYCAALQSFEPGRAELNREDRGVQDKVMRHLIELVAKMHRLNIDTMNLPEFVRPKTPLEHSLLEIEAVEEPNLYPVSICKTNVLAAFGKRWLINHAPPSVERTVLLQGDTGPANFLYDPQSARVTAIVDWEWAHFGDPLEDLGNILVRDLFYPSAGGDLTPYFRYYGELTGFALDRKKIDYYRIHQLVRSVQGLGYLADVLDWQTPIPLNLGYQAFIDVTICEAMAEASGVTRIARLLPTFTPDNNALQAMMARQIEAFILPHISDDFGRFMASGHISLARYLDLRERYGKDFEAEERASLSRLLDATVDDLPTYRRRLIARIETLALKDEAPVLDHLLRMAQMQSALMAPLVTPFVQARWAKFDL